MIPYWRLSIFYFFYFSCLGALVPYWGLYLFSLHFSVVEIGELMALLMATKIISPNIWGWIADRTGKHMAVVQIGSLLSLLSFTVVFFVDSYWGVALTMFFYTFFWNATLAQFEAVTLNYLQSEPHRYSPIRVWGSIGFILAASLFGPLLEIYGIRLLLWLLLGIFAAIFISSLLVTDPAEQEHTTTNPSILQVLQRKEVIALILVSFLMQVGHAPYYAFFTLYMEQHQVSRGVVGQLWSLGVIMEVIIFTQMYRLIPRYGLAALLMAALVIAALRWVLTALFADYFWIIVVAQTMHAASFGIFHAVMIAYYHQAFSGRLQGRGLALYSSVSYGAGGAVGSYIAGLLWNGYGSTTIFWFAAVASIGALLLARKYMLHPTG